MTTVVLVIINVQICRGPNRQKLSGQNRLCYIPMERSCHGYLRVAKTISRWAVGLISLKWDKMNNWNMVLEAGQQHHLYSHQVNIWRYIWLKSPDRGKHKYSDPIFQKSWAKQIGIKKKQQQYKNNKNTISQHWSWGRYTNISIST